MSSNSSTNYWIGIAVGVVVGIFTFGAGYGVSAAIMAGGLASSVTGYGLNAIFAKNPSMRMKVSPFRNKGTVNQKDAATQSLEIASSSEAILIPVIFGTQRVGTNYLRYDQSTFRNTPIIERVQRDPALVAYAKAKEAYRKDPSHVEYQINKHNPSQSGGKGGGGSAPATTGMSKTDKINAYAQVLLEKDAKGKKKLPIEYDEYEVGKRYYLSWELGICMGPVDRLERILSYAGENVVVDNTVDPDVTGANEYTFTGTGTTEGGTIIFYPGTATQTRKVGDPYAGDGMNYRHVCFAVMADYYMGNDAIPRSYAFELTRFPVCLDENGDPIADFPTRGAAAGETYEVTNLVWTAATGIAELTSEGHGLSEGDLIILEGFDPSNLPRERTVLEVTEDTFRVKMPNPGVVKTYGIARKTHPSYYDANPAACLYEIFTNKMWGRGLDPRRIDIESFAAAARYFEQNNIGMSFTLENQSVLSDAVETIRSHVATTVYWSQGKLKCLCLLDRSNAYNPRVIISSEHVINPKMTRPTWGDTINELRGTFSNRLNNYQNELVIEHEPGSLATTQSINSQNVTLAAFSNRDVASRMVKRLIAELGVPQGTLEFTMNRFESRLEPGMFVEFRWTEWSAGPTTTYWRVTEITDQDQDDDGIKVTLVEDLYCTPVQGIPESFEAPVPAYEGDVSNLDEDLHIGDEQGASFDDGTFQFVMAELPSFVTDYDRMIAIFANRADGAASYVRFWWREAGTSDEFKAFGTLSPWATLATLVNAIPKGTTTLERNRLIIELQLLDPTGLGVFLETCNHAPDDSSNLDELLASETNWLLINDEIFQVAQAEAAPTPGNVYLTCYFRARLGSELEAHPPGALCAFTYDFSPYMFSLRYDSLPETEIEFMAIPYSVSGRAGREYRWNYTIRNLARKALRITNWTVEKAGSDWTVTFRPRFHNRGAEADSDFDSSINSLTAEVPEFYEWHVMPCDSAGDPLLSDPVLVDVDFIAEDGTDPEKGMASFTYSVPPGTESVLLYTTYDGTLGLPATIT